MIDERSCGIDFMTPYCKVGWYVNQWLVFRHLLDYEEVVLTSLEIINKKQLPFWGAVSRSGNLIIGSEFALLVLA